MFYRGSGSDFSCLFHFSMTFMSANRITADWTTRFAASNLGLFCLSMYHKKDTRLIRVNVYKLLEIFKGTPYYFFIYRSAQKALNILSSV